MELSLKEIGKKILLGIVLVIEPFYRLGEALFKKFLDLKLKYKLITIFVILIFFDTLRGWIFGGIVYLLLLTI